MSSTPQTNPLKLICHNFAVCPNITIIYGEKGFIRLGLNLKITKLPFESNALDPQRSYYIDIESLGEIDYRHNFTSYCCKE